MKVEGQVTLTVHGREMTFSKQQLVAILEQYFDNEATMPMGEEEVNPVLTEGVWFKIDPQTIDQKLFQESRADKEQEERRKEILEAFEEMKKYPANYQDTFYTLIPEKNGKDDQTVAELIAYANSYTSSMADWVEQRFEWAQRISNGESWEAVCNDGDKVSYFRIIQWKNGNYRISGGASVYDNFYPYASVDDIDCGVDDIVWDTVPLIVLKRRNTVH